MKYKHIVFDIDGTLIDTEYAVLHSLQETIKGLSAQCCQSLHIVIPVLGRLNIRDNSPFAFNDKFLFLK